MVDDVLKSIEAMPAFPGAALQVLNLIGKGDYSIADMVNVIKFDPSITANILKLSNSAFFRASQKVTTIHEAVVNLGQQNLLQVVQTAGVSVFYKRPAKGYLIKPRALWKHCVAVALMSQILSRKIYHREDPVLYTAALLHDVGKIVLGEFIYKSLEKIADLVTKRGYTLLAAEKKVIGIDHAELGGKIAEFWNFPPGLRDAIILHHNPGQLSEQDAGEGKSGKATAALIYLADQVCVMIGLNGGSDSYSRSGLEEMLTAFRLQRKDLDMAVVLLQDGLKQAQDLIDVVPE